METEPRFPTSRDVAEALLLDAGQRSKLLAYAGARFGLALEDAEDVLQDTALELLRQRTIVRNPRGFVFSVFHGRCCDFLESRRRSRRLLPNSLIGTAPVTGPAPDETIDDRLALRQVFGEVSTSCRRLLLAYYVEGRSLREAASAIALAYSGVWKTMTRCLRRLRRCLD